MKNSVKLRDDTEVFIRKMRKDDLIKSLDFFQSLPAEDRAYLRRDVTRKSVIQQRIHETESKKIKRLVAVYEGAIVADAALELQTHSWKTHVGEFRLIVAPEFRRKGLGMVMARELYFLALKENLEEIMVKMMRPQVAAHRIFKRLGFDDAVTLPEYVTDLSGTKQDLILMRCNLKDMWQELEYFLQESDWHRTR